MRTFNPAEVREQTDPYANETLGFYPEIWLEDQRNIALVDDRGNICLFEYEKKGVYTGHFFFEDRGRRALHAGRYFLDEILSYDEVQIIRGLTPLQKLGARWLSRQLGFTSYGVVQTVIGPCELFIYSKESA